MGYGRKDPQTIRIEATTDAGLKQKVDGLESQLAQTSQEIFYKGVTFSKQKRPLLSIVDDDGHADVWNILKPVAESENVPITLAVIPVRVEDETTNNFLTLSQLNQLKSIGFEIVSHTYNHVNLKDSTPEVRKFEMEESKKWLKEKGFEDEVIVYPYGGVDKDVETLARKYFACGVYIDRPDLATTTSPVNTYNLGRIYIDNGVAYVKAKIDEAVANNSWMIIGTHVERGLFTSADLIDIIQYAKNKGIEIVSIKKGLQIYGNAIDLPDFKIGSGGEMQGSLGTMMDMNARSTIITNDTPISAFPYNRVTRRYVTVAEKEGFPENEYGTLITHRMGTDEWSMQEYHLMRFDRSYRRRWDNANGVWLPWVKNSPQVIRTLRSVDVGIISAMSPKSINVSSSAFTVGSNVLINFPDNISGGIVCMPVISTDGICGLRFINILNTDVTVGVINIDFTIFKY